MNDFALIDEMSGLTTYLENFMNSHDMPETSKDRIKAYMHHYESSDKPKAVAV